MMSTSHLPTDMCVSFIRYHSPRVYDAVLGLEEWADAVLSLPLGTTQRVPKPLEMKTGYSYTNALTLARRIVADHRK